MRITISSHTLAIPSGFVKGQTYLAVLEMDPVSKRRGAGVLPGHAAALQHAAVLLAAEVPVHPDGLGNGAGGDVDTESNGRGACLVDDRVAVYAAAGGTQGVEILIRRPFRQLGGYRGALSEVDGDAL